ncbi:NUDIX hydrolase [Pseudonocardia sp. H11422]|uniref:NUDIX hydrolase n=1 Tax=Pseudonocardia sp. H11422 TaxID=2835866 RepID=UPI0027E34AA9|nr:NUDIX domain-containing protein [Pseudonocardia sp. H11422]
MSDTPKHSVSVAGIVVDDLDRVLVIQRRDNHQWEPPGGVLEIDESPHDGVQREIREETGMLVEVQNLTGVYKNMKHGIVALVFRCSAAGGNAQPTAESRQVRWIPADEVKRSMNPAFAIRVLDALSGAGVAVRTHDGVEIIP